MDYVRTQAITLGRGCILRAFADVPQSEYGLPALDIFAHMSKYLETWMYFA